MPPPQQKEGPYPGVPGLNSYCNGIARVSECYSSRLKGDCADKAWGNMEIIAWCAMYLGSCRRRGL